MAFVKNSFSRTGDTVSISLFSNMPVRAFAMAGSLRSVPKIWILSWLSPKNSLKQIAKEYTSWPVLQPATHIRVISPGILLLKIAGKKQTFQFRADIINAGNLLNSDWGVSRRVSTANILNVSTTPSVTNNYTPTFQLQTQTDDQGRRYLAKDTYQNNTSVANVWQAQFSLRYIFGK